MLKETEDSSEEQREDISEEWENRDSFDMFKEPEKHLNEKEIEEVMGMLDQEQLEHLCDSQVRFDMFLELLGSLKAGKGRFEIWEAHPDKVQEAFFIVENEE